MRRRGVRRLGLDAPRRSGRRFGGRRRLPRRIIPASNRRAAPPSARTIPRITNGNSDGRCLISMAAVHRCRSRVFEQSRVGEQLLIGHGDAVGNIAFPRYDHRRLVHRPLVAAVDGDNGVGQYAPKRSVGLGLPRPIQRVGVAGRSVGAGRTRRRRLERRGSRWRPNVPMVPDSRRTTSKNLLGETRRNPHWPERDLALHCRHLREAATMRGGRYGIFTPMRVQKAALLTCRPHGSDLVK